VYISCGKTCSALIFVIINMNHQLNMLHLNPIRLVFTIEGLTRMVYSCLGGYRIVMVFVFIRLYSHLEILRNATLL
jgi:hypothetical protein